MRELLTERHGKDRPASTDGGSKEIDALWDTVSLSIQEGGTLRHDIGPESGHRVARVKMNYNTALITSFLDFDRPIRFIVKTVNPQCIKHSNKSY